MPSENKKRVIVTGGSGKVGQHVIRRLLEHGHRVLNLDLCALPSDLSSQVHTLRVDLCNSGQVYSALGSHFRLGEPFLDPYQPADAVVHLAGYARNMIVADNETFQSNVQSAFNVLEAGCRLGIKKIVLASSICVYGITYAEGDVDFTSFPVNEEALPRPMDAYSLSKLCMENIAQSFALRFADVDIYALRVGAVISLDEYGTVFSKYIERPQHWKVHGWSYVDARDLAQMFTLCLETNGLGYQVFNAVNDGISNECDTMEFLHEQCPNVPITRTMHHDEAPISNEKIRALLGFREEFKWQMFVDSAK